MPRFRLAALRAASVATAFGLAAWAAGPSVRAGEASSSFAITITSLPERPGTCSASTAQGAPQVTCRPTIGGVLGSSGRGSDSQVLLGYRRPDGVVRIAGEMIEVGQENHYAWSDQVPPDMASPEYSTELVSANGRAYVQYTVSW